MPRTPKGQTQRSYAGRFLYGAVGNYRLRRVLNTVLDAANQISAAVAPGEPPVTATVTIPAKDSTAPVALSGDVAVSAGTRPSWPKETVAGTVNVSKLPVQGGRCGDNSTVDLPYLGTGSPASIANAAYPRVSGAVAAATPALDITYGNGDSDLGVAFGTVQTNPYVAGGTYQIDATLTDVMGRETPAVLGTFVVAGVVLPVFTVAPALANILATSADVLATLSENGTIYVVVVADGDPAPSVAEILLGQESGGGAPVAAANGAATASVQATVPVTGLTTATAYDVYVAAKDTAGNPVAVAVKLDLTTA
jgi:hypothetical protein